MSVCTFTWVPITSSQPHPLPPASFQFQRLMLGKVEGKKKRNYQVCVWAEREDRSEVDGCFKAHEGASSTLILAPPPRIHKQYLLADKVNNRGYINTILVDIITLCFPRKQNITKQDMTGFRLPRHVLACIPRQYITIAARQQKLKGI
jgi:hypothetical protein